jgi:hypothetical protein
MSECLTKILYRILLRVMGFNNLICNTDYD